MRLKAQEKINHIEKVTLQNCHKNEQKQALHAGLQAKNVTLQPQSFTTGFYRSIYCTNRYVLA